MSSDSASDSQDVIRAIYAVSLFENYLWAAASALIFFDYFLTFNRELELIWRKPRSYFTVLFLVTRYLPFIDVFGLLVYGSSTKVTGRMCAIRADIEQALSATGVWASVAILLARAAAVWGNSKPILWALFTFMVLGIGGSVLSTVLYDLDSSARTSVSITEAVLNLGLCVTDSNVMTHSSALKSAGPWIVVLVFETVAVCLLLPKAFLERRPTGRSRLYVAVYMKGFGYYLCTLAVSILNIVFVLHRIQFGLHHNVIILDRVMHAIIACRLVLSIRGAAYNTPQTIILSDLEFYPLRRSRQEPWADNENNARHEPEGEAM